MITTILQPLNYRFIPMRKREAQKIIQQNKIMNKWITDKGFILHVGGNQWYKNRRGVCEIYGEVYKLREKKMMETQPLILAGKKPTKEIIEFIQNNKHLKILFVVSPSNEEINALYCMAKLFLFPSIKEGFGWPVVEAMACGCPVVTTNREPLTEAGGNAAIYIDPKDIGSAAITTNEVMEWSEKKGRIKCRWVMKMLENIVVLNFYVNIS